MLAASLTTLTANALLHGFLAFAIGAATGRKGVAVAVAAAVMVLGWLLAGLLPLIDGAAGLVKFIPWTWFNGSRPLLNGFDGGHLALQMGSVVLLLLVGVVGFTRRDLRLASPASLRERLRSFPVLNTLGDRFAISARSRGLFTLLFSQRLALVSLIAISLFALMGVAIGPLNSAMAGQLGQLTASMPTEMLAMMGAGDMSTAEGF